MGLYVVGTQCTLDWFVLFDTGGREAEQHKKINKYGISFMNVVTSQSNVCAQPAVTCDDDQSRENVLKEQAETRGLV